MKKVWCIVADTNGAHEAECIMSIWTTEAQAEAEGNRLVAENVSCGCYDGDVHISEVKLDEPSDNWIS